MAERSLRSRNSIKRTQLDSTDLLTTQLRLRVDASESKIALNRN
jgi:hypothetical protein